LSQQRPIPGMNGKSGLLPAQKHATAAILTRLEMYSEAVAIGEMGVGKTTVGAAIAAGRNARRTIILCPPHLVDKWQREFKAVWPGVRTMHLQSISDVDQFFVNQPDDAPLVGVLKQTTARSASGWEHAYDYGGPASHNYGSQGYTDIERPWGKVLSAYKLMDMPAEERPALSLSKWPFTEHQIHALQQRGIRCPVCGATQFLSGRPLTVSELKTATRLCSNEQCRSPLYQFTRRRSDSQVRGSFKLYAERERTIRSYTDKVQPVPFHELEKWHGTAVRDTFGYGKVPLAGYIKKRGRRQPAGRRLDLLLVDEVHQYKGFDSDQGYAMHHLAQAAEKVVALTGTIYGGKASSLFYLLFRLAPEMCRAYIEPDATGQRRLRSRDWVSAYGILQRIETVTLDEDGKQTANSRSNVRFKELPGGSPAMLPWLLNRSVFLSLGDMGFPLPEYTEIPISVPMAPAQAVLYEDLKEQLKEELKERLIRGDKSLLAGYLYALLFWPDSPRRAKVVSCPRTGHVVASVPGLPDDFIGPKEEEIIELCLREKAQGRRVLLLCQQTDTLDIQPEWKGMLEEAGLKTAILRAAPNKREEWVEKQVKAGVDVIITHPRKVETGIDLLDFPTIVWMAIDYSVYTVLQASRRSWRIGQTRPVKVYYFAYEETIQEDALRLVAAKVAAALRVNGDTVGDDSLADLDDLTSGDLVATLAKIITGDVQIEARSLQQAFAEANASLRQANALIGEYSIVDDDEDDEPFPVLEGVPQRPLPAIASNGHVTRQPSLFSSGQVKPNGVVATINGKEQRRDNCAPHQQEETALSSDGKPPVPRPRLLISQLGLK
ncbi:MAG TPA: DEAD/DEAH box helicase, partial [Chloroflexota bacterium]|nr:DEAD/DEAH box helicase [Chloroflexota bacterium]